VGEQAAALAAWQCSPLILPVGEGVPARDVASLLAGLSAQWEGRRWQGEWISERLQQVAEAPRWPGTLPQTLAESSPVLTQLAEVALPLYWQTSNFTVLHMVTGSRAAAIVATQLPSEWQGQWQTLMWQATWPACNGLSWQQVLERALASLDDHVIKLVHCCWREQASRPGDASRYLAVAARAVGLLNAANGRDAA